MEKVFLLAWKLNVDKRAIAFSNNDLNFACTAYFFILDNWSYIGYILHFVFKRKKFVARCQECQMETSAANLNNS